MYAEQALKSQLHISITCSQIMHAEQALKSQFKINLTCSQNMHAERVLKITISSKYYLQRNHDMLNRF